VTAVAVTGLNEFLRDLRAADSALPKEVRSLLNEIGQGIMEPEIERRMSALIKNSKGNGLLASVRSRSTQREGRVLAGYGSRVPHAGWWEFGGTTRSPRGNTFRERVPGGRTMYPALADKENEIQRAAEEALNRLVRLLGGEA